MELCYYEVMIYRKLSDLHSFTAANKALVIYGPRRVGKTTLLKNFN
jgi:predicted AAA+ superfamily ATPase